MKKITLLLLILTSFQSISQDFKAIEVKGKIVVEGGDLFGISIFNKTAFKEVVTDENGEFVLTVKLNDSIEVRSLQFQNVSFQINKSIIESKIMKVFLIEEINKLDPIFVSGYRLSNDLETQIKRTKTFNPKMNTLYFGMVNENQAYSESDKIEVRNTAMDTERLRYINGLNIVNIVDQLLLPLFRSEVKDKAEAGIPEVPIESIKYYFGSEFVVDNFDIPEHRVEEFIRYVESDNFDFSLLNYGKEMELLEVIYTKSLLFLNKNE